MRQAINTLDHLALQDLLDKTFGPDVFKSVLDETTDQRLYYIEYSEEQDPTAAIELANTMSMEYFKDMKKFYFGYVDRKAFKVMDKYSKDFPTLEEAAVASLWIANPETECPESVVNYAVQNDLILAQAAEKICEQRTIIEQFLIDAEAVRKQGRAQMFNASTFEELKDIANDVRTQLRVLRGIDDQE